MLLLRLPLRRLRLRPVSDRNPGLIDPTGVRKPSLGRPHSPEWSPKQVKLELLLILVRAI